MLRRKQSRSSRRSIFQSTRAAKPMLEQLELRRMLNGVGIVVNTTDDETVVNATTSLREAITLAENTAGDDTITFDNTVFTGSLHSILLTQGEFHITTTDKITIQGPGPGLLQLDAD